ncbi:MAG: anti-sigma factor [Phormidesmis sp. CAN_BIN44]|nr:anti-sigma factor [Phormidesmis sp. CAN_BIN44]
MFDRLYPTQIAMIRPNDDTNQTDLVAGYILNDLSPDEADRLDRALAEVPALSEEIESFQEAFSLLPYDLPLLEPSARIRDKIINAASHSLADTSVKPLHSNVVPLASPRRRNWKRWIPAIGTGIAAVAVAALGLNQIQLSQQSQQTIALQQQLEATNTELKRLRSELEANQGTIVRLSQPHTQVYALVGATSKPKNNRRATARLLAKSGDPNVTLFAQDLPKLPNNQVYRLWSVATPTATPTYCGQFRQDGSGTAQWVAPSAACTKNPLKFLITLDALTDPVTSAGPLVMRSSS